MHIVFVCDETTISNGAAVNICRNLSQYFLSLGHKVSILGNRENKTAPDFENIYGVDYYRFYYPINRITHKILKDWSESKNIIKLAASLAVHPVTAAVGFARAVFGVNPIEKRYISRLKKLHSEQPIDIAIAIATGGSFYTIHALSKSRRDFVRVGYMLDPYWKNHTTGGPKAKKQELFAFAHMDKVVIPKLLEEDYNDPDFKNYKSKIMPCEFPGIIEDFNQSTSEIRLPGQVSLVFAGNFYSGIRSPEYLLQLIKNCDKKIVFNIFGGIYGSFDSRTQRLIDELVSEGKICMHEAVSGEKVKDVLGRADVLVNIGNTVDNQLPSKIFEYFSSCKPVVHIQKIPDCPCVKYMNMYPCAIVLKENAPLKENAGRLEDFCLSEHKSVDFSTVKQIFSQCTVDYVGNVLLGTADEK